MVLGRETMRIPARLGAQDASFGVCPTLGFLFQSSGIQSQVKQWARRGFRSQLLLLALGQDSKPCEPWFFSSSAWEE